MRDPVLYPNQTRNLTQHLTRDPTPISDPKLIWSQILTRYSTPKQKFDTYLTYDAGVGFWIENKIYSQINIKNQYLRLELRMKVEVRFFPDVKYLCLNMRNISWFEKYLSQSNMKKKNTFHTKHTFWSLFSSWTIMSFIRCSIKSEFTSKSSSWGQNVS